jgi:hypothetical protein
MRWFGNFSNWLTVTPDDKKTAAIAAVSARRGFQMEQERQQERFSMDETCKLVDADAGACAMHHLAILDIVREHILGWDDVKCTSKPDGGFYGKTECFGLANEEQGRQSLHAHVLSKICGCDVTTAATLLRFLSDFIGPEGGSEVAGESESDPGGHDELKEQSRGSDHELAADLGHASRKSSPSPLPLPSWFVDVDGELPIENHGFAMKHTLHGAVVTQVDVDGPANGTLSVGDVIVSFGNAKGSWALSGHVTQETFESQVISWAESCEEEEVEALQVEIHAEGGAIVTHSIRTLGTEISNYGFSVTHTLKGAVVASVSNGGPADGQLEVGDLIVSLANAEDNWCLTGFATCKHFIDIWRDWCFTDDGKCTIEFHTRPGSPSHTPLPER